MASRFPTQVDTFGSGPLCPNAVLWQGDPCHALANRLQDITFSSAPEYDSSDQLVNDYKDGYRDVDGAVVEPDWIEP